MSKKLMIILMTLLTTSILGGAVIAYAQEVEGNQVASENMLSMLTDSEAEVKFLFETIVGDGGEVPEDAIEALEEAQQLHAEAQGLYDEGSYEECVEKATEALNKYGKALTEATPEETEVMTTQKQEESEETEKMTYLTTAIKKAGNRIEKLEEIADDLDAHEIDTEDVRGLLLEAKGILENINDILPENPEEAENMLTIAKNLIGQATEMLKNKGEPMKQEKMEHFVQQAIYHAYQLENKMEKIMKKHGLSTSEMVTEYGVVIQGFEGVAAGITKNDLKDSITELKAWVKHMDQVGKGHVDDEAGLSLEIVEIVDKHTEMQTHMELYRNRVNAMTEGDPIRLKIQDLLNEVEILLEKAETTMAEGNKDLADELTEDAQEILERIDGLLDDVGKRMDKELKPDKGNKEEKTNGKGKNKVKDSKFTEEEPEDPENNTT